MTISPLRRIVMWIIAVPMAWIAGMLAAFTVQLLRVNVLYDKPPRDAVLPITTLLVAALMMYLLLRGARGVLNMLQRGFMIGTIQWLVMVTIVSAYGYEVTAPPDAGPPRASWEPAGPITRLPGTPDTLFTGMALLCAAGWGMALIAERAIVHRETRRRAATEGDRARGAVVRGASAGRGASPLAR